MKDFKIVMTGPGRGEVFLDGEKVESVVAVKFGARVNDVNRVILTLNVGNGDITSMSDVSRIYSWGWWRYLIRPLREIRERFRRWQYRRALRCEHDWQPDANYPDRYEQCAKCPEYRCAACHKP